MIRIYSSSRRQHSKWFQQEISGALASLLWAWDKCELARDETTELLCDLEQHVARLRAAKRRSGVELTLYDKTGGVNRVTPGCLLIEVNFNPHMIPLPGYED